MGNTAHLEQQLAALEAENQRLTEQNDLLLHNLAILQEAYQILRNAPPTGSASLFPADSRASFDALISRYPEHYVHEHWQSLDNPGRLDTFSKNHQSGVSDFVLVAQESSPVTYHYMLWYPGGGSDYYLLPLGEHSRSAMALD